MRPVVLLHAFPLGPEMWADVADALRAETTVLTPALPGSATGAVPSGAQPASQPASPWDQPSPAPSLDLLADKVAADILGLGQGPAVVVGLSMGGYVAMAVQRRHPGVLAGLVLANTKAAGDIPDAAAGREGMARRLLSEGTAPLVAMIPNLLGSTARKSRPELLARVEAMARSANPVGAAWAQRAMLARPDASAQLARCALPVLLIAGTEDVVTPPALARDLAQAMPDARIRILEGVGHLSALEDPAAFTGAVRDFLRAL